jgi:hypothetical protein
LPNSEKLFHHEEHEEHEVLKKGIKTSERFFFVLFVSFVVKSGLPLAALRLRARFFSVFFAQSRRVRRGGPVSSSAAFACQLSLAHEPHGGGKFSRRRQSVF